MRFSRLVHFAAIVLFSAAVPISQDHDSSLSTDISSSDISSTDTASTDTLSTEKSGTNTSTTDASRVNIPVVSWSSQQLEQTEVETQTEHVYDLASVNTRLQRRVRIEASGRQRQAIPGTRLQRRARTKLRGKGSGKGGKQPGKKNNSGHRPTSKTNKKRPTGLTGKPKPKKSLDLLPAINKFDMLLNFTMAGKSSSTREISPDMMLRARMPQAITFKMIPYTFPKSSNLFRARTQAGFERAMVMLKQASLVKLQSIRPISGEVDLTQIMQQTMGSVVNEILAAVGVKSARWHMVGLGKGAIPDLALTELKANGQSQSPRAVIEVKTTSSLTNAMMEEIIDQVERQEYELHRITNGTHLIPTLMGDLEIRGVARKNRRKSTKVLEQVVTEMFSTGARVGALTNLEDWLVLQRTGGAISASHVSGVSGEIPARKSRGLEIMLGMSMKALGRGR